MAVPAVRNTPRRVSRVAELQAPDSIDLHRRNRELGLDASALEVLEQGNAVEHQRSRQVDRVDTAALAGTVDAGRAGA